MVTEIHKFGPRRLYLREHRKAKGVSAKDMSGRVGIERESVYRWEREPWRLDEADQANYAHALQLEPEDDLWRPPSAHPPEPSLDDMVAEVPEDVRDMARGMAEEIIRRFATGRKS